MPSLTTIAEGLLAKAKRIDGFLESNGREYPSYSNDGLADLPKDLELLRMELANDTNELKKLVQGPVMFASSLSTAWTDQLTLRVLCHYNIAKAVPIDDTVTYAEIAKHTNLSEKYIFRFVRSAMTNNIFDEDPSAPGRVKHTAISRRMATDQGFVDWLGLHVDELGPASVKFLESTGKFGVDPQEPNQTAHALHNETSLPFYSCIGQDPERARRFGGAMQFLTKDEEFDLRHIWNAYDWRTFDKDGTRIVDLGGGNGQVSQYLATQLGSSCKAEIVVRDLPYVIASAIEALPEDLKGRVLFEACDFMKAHSPDKPVDAFFMRWILHNWPESYCIKILQNLIPALRPGSKVLLFENVLNDEPLKKLSDKISIAFDMTMATGFNGQERTKSAFVKLMRDADSRFVVEGFHRPEGSAMSLVEVTWKP